MIPEEILEMLNRGERVTRMLASGRQQIIYPTEAHIEHLEKIIKQGIATEAYVWNSMGMNL